MKRIIQREIKSNLAKETVFLVFLQFLDCRLQFLDDLVSRCQAFFSVLMYDFLAHRERFHGIQNAPKLAFKRTY